MSCGFRVPKVPGTETELVPPSSVSVPLFGGVETGFAGPLTLLLRASFDGKEEADGAV
jgi:hypothetical protein